MDKHIRDEFWNAFEKSPFIMMRLENAPGHSEPMTAQLDRDARHTIWFFTSRHNRLAPGGPAMGQFVGKGHDVFACVAGALVEETDQAVVDRHWSNAAKAWFPGGRGDPELMMLRFEIADAEVWVTDVTVKGLFKMLTGAPLRQPEAGKHEVGQV